MKAIIDSTRRRFFWHAGAALTGTLVAVPWNARGAAPVDDATRRAGLATLEDVNAIRDLERAYVQHVNAAADVAHLCTDAGAARLDGVRRLTADALGGEDAIEIAADGRAAAARLHYAAETERPIEPPCSLVDMARAQGGGVTRRTEHGVLESALVKLDGVWKIERAAFRPA